MTTTIDAAAGPATGVNRFEALQKATPTFKPSRTGQQRALEAAIWPDRPRVAGRQSFAGAVRAEWIKLRTLTSTWVTSVITIAITVLFGAGLAIGYASGQIRSSMMAVPRRGRLFAAKALVVSGFSFVLGLLSVTLAYAASYPFMKGHAGSLTDAHYLGLFWGTGLSFAIIALMAQGIGHLTRSTAGAITVVVSLLFVVPIPFNLMAGHWQWANKVLGLLPDTLSTAVSDPFSLAHQWGQAGTAAFLQHWQAVAVFTAWAIVPLVIAAVVFTHRDA